MDAGTPEEKSRLLFAMHDIDGNGFLSREEFSTLLRFATTAVFCLSVSELQCLK